MFLSWHTTYLKRSSATFHSIGGHTAACTCSTRCWEWRQDSDDPHSRYWRDSSLSGWFRLRLLLLQPKLQIWIAFSGTGKHFQHLSVNSMYGSLGQSKAMELPMFHAITGCDTTSALQGRWKSQHLKRGMCIVTLRTPWISLREIIIKCYIFRTFQSFFFIISSRFYEI